MKLGASNSSFEVVCVNNEHNVYRMKKNSSFMFAYIYILK